MDLNSFFNNAQTKQQSVNEEEATVVNDSTPKNWVWKTNDY
ncbi:hypothetical protein ONA23_02270 [Mycoplasmopsis cynos]|nr:hypothetical protein [Mycoplasmopsis cynos]WAM06997.1 hypothetical protein ONA23_02270 [Mycoplasmopsis cynos]